MFNDTMSPIYDDEYDIFSPPTLEYKVYCDYDMPPIYDDYNDYYCWGIITRYTHDQGIISRTAQGLVRVKCTRYGPGYSWANRPNMTRPWKEGHRRTGVRVKEETG